MSVWTTRTLDRVRDYIVIKHKLPNVNYIVNGIRFRGGYAVVERNSKSHHELKKIPILRGASEYPLTHLRKLPFIIRTSDVKLVYGQDVYINFLKQEQEQKLKSFKIEEEVSKPVKTTQCGYKNSSNEVCNSEKVIESPSGYCRQHLLNDPRLAEFGIEMPEVLTKQEKKEFRRETSKKLYALKQEGKF